MNLDQMHQDMVRDITRTGMRASVLLQGVILQKVDEETLRWGLGELNLSDHMSRYLPHLVPHPECPPAEHPSPAVQLGGTTGLSDPGIRFGLFEG
jgi:hypothetical protein